MNITKQIWAPSKNGNNNYIRMGRWFSYCLPLMKPWVTRTYYSLQQKCTDANINSGETHYLGVWYIIFNGFHAWDCNTNGSRTSCVYLGETQPTSKTVCQPIFLYQNNFALTLNIIICSDPNFARLFGVTCTQLWTPLELRSGLKEVSLFSKRIFVIGSRTSDLVRYSSGGS